MNVIKLLVWTNSAVRKNQYKTANIFLILKILTLKIMKIILINSIYAKKF